jgi:hypothetical protein
MSDWIGGLMGGLGSLFGGGIAAIGQSEANRQSIDFAKNKYQISAKDMKKAGINPMMAGLAGVAPGGLPEIGNVGQPIGEGIANAVQTGAETSKILADTKGSKLSNTWAEMSMPTRIKELENIVENIHFDTEETKQNILNLIAEANLANETALTEAARRDLFAAQTTREKEEALRIVQATRLLSEQVISEAMNRQLTEAQTMEALSEIAKNNEDMRLINQQIRESLEREENIQISNDWLKREKTVGMTNDILQMVLDVVGAIRGSGGSRSEIYIHK